MASDRSEFNQMNLAAVRRHDPYTVEILDSATQVALYRYSVENTEWEKTEVQGALFVYKRSGCPFHSCMVLNRLSTSNLIQPLSADLEFQLQTPFLLYRTGHGDIRGLWFFYENECNRLFSLMEKLCQTSSSGSSIDVRASNNISNNSIDLLSLISRAAESRQRPSPLTIGPPSVGGPVNQESSGSADTAGTALSQEPASGGSITVQDLFAKASKTGHALIGKQSVRSISVSEVEDSIPDNGSLQRLISQPPPHLSAAPPTSGVTRVPMKEAADVSRIQQLFSSGLQLEDSAVSVAPSGPAPPPSGPARSPAPPPKPVHNGALDLLSAAPPPVVRPLSDITGGDKLHSSVTCVSSSVPLMSPMMFSASCKSKLSGSMSGSVAAAATDRAAALEQLQPLTRGQMAQAFSYLLRHDDEFVGRLHDAYVKSLSEHFKRS